MERICEFLQIPLMLSVATAYSSHTSHDIIPLPWPSNRILSNTRLGRLNPLVSGQPAANECLLEASELGSIWCWHRGHRHRSKVKWSGSRSVISDSLRPHELYSPWYSPGQNTAVGSLSLLQRIYPTRDRTQVSCIAGGFFTSWATRGDKADTEATSN